MTDPLLPMLSLLQLTDSLFPSGLYALSHGLEAYARHGLLTAATLEPLIADLVESSAGPADGIALARAHDAATPGDLALAVAADERLTAAKLAREPRETSRRIGRQVPTNAAAIFPSPVLTAYLDLVKMGAAPGNHAVVVGLVSASLGAPRLDALAADLYAFAASCASAALRMALVDHRQVQATLHRLRPVIAATARVNDDRPIEEIGGCTPFAEIMAMQHETAEARLFAS